jgi:hypothetical protein
MWWFHGGVLISVIKAVNTLYTMVVRHRGAALRYHGTLQLHRIGGSGSKRGGARPPHASPPSSARACSTDYIPSVAYLPWRGRSLYTARVAIGNPPKRPEQPTMTLACSPSVRLLLDPTRLRDGSYDPATAAFAARRLAQCGADFQTPQTWTANGSSTRPAATISRGSTATRSSSVSGHSQTLHCGGRGMGSTSRSPTHLLRHR